jgi:uncharacterized protein (TIGR02118 family)
MTKILIAYPAGEAGFFDLDYYVNVHMPRSIELLSQHPGFRSVSVNRGVQGAEPGIPPHFLALCEFVFDSADDFLEAFLPHATELQGDMPNYTDVVPVIQINDVLMNVAAPL